MMISEAEDDVGFIRSWIELHRMMELKEAIENTIGFSMSFERIYKWIAFLPSKVNSNLPVVNRYFGALVSFQDKRNRNKKT